MCYVNKVDSLVVLICQLRSNSRKVSSGIPQDSGEENREQTSANLPGRISVISDESLSNRTNNTHSALTHSALPRNPEDTCRTPASEISVTEHTIRLFRTVKTHLGNHLRLASLWTTLGSLASGEKPTIFSLPGSSLMNCAVS